MSLKTVLFLITLTLIFNSYSQNRIEKIDKPGTFFPKYSGDKKWKMFFDFDARRSVLLSQKIKINGIRIGCTYKGVNRFGIGLYSLKDKIQIEGLAIDIADAHSQPDPKVSFSFTTLFYEKVFFKTKRWEISLPASCGIGSLNSEYKNNLGNYKKLKKDNFSLVSLGVNTNFYILPWLYPRVMVGYRFAFNSNKNIASSFTKPFYAFGISLNPFGAYMAYKIWKKEKPLTQ